MQTSLSSKLQEEKQKNKKKNKREIIKSMTEMPTAKVFFLFK